MNDLSIRHPSENDAYNLIRMLIPQFSERTDKSLSDGQYFKKWEAVFKKMINSDFVKIFIAEIDGSIVGVTTAYLLPRLELAGFYAVIEDVYVKESERSKGIGSKIFEKVSEYLKAESASHIILSVGKENTKAQEFYKRLGFTEESKGMKLNLI